MKGILRYFTHDPEFINSREGWSVTSIDSNNFYSHHLVDETDREVRDRFEKGLIKSGDEVEYEVGASSLSIRSKFSDIYFSLTSRFVKLD